MSKCLVIDCHKRASQKHIMRSGKLFMCIIMSLHQASTSEIPTQEDNWLYIDKLSFSQLLCGNGQILAIQYSGNRTIPLKTSLAGRGQGEA